MRLRSDCLGFAFSRCKGLLPYRSSGGCLRDLVFEHPPKSVIGNAINYTLKNCTRSHASSPTQKSHRTVGSGTGAVVYRLSPAVSAVSGFVPV